MITKKHYEAIAEIIKREYLFDEDAAAIYSRPAIVRVACNLADYFKQDNPRFDRSRFLKASGIDS